MLAKGFSDKTEQFILNCVDSVEQIDILLLLFSEQSPWTAESISKELRTSVNSAQKRLHSLEKLNLVKRDAHANTYQFDFEHKNNSDLVTDLQSAYKTHKYKIIQMIFDKPQKPIKHLAEAFRLKQDDEDE